MARPPSPSSNRTPSPPSDPSDRASWVGEQNPDQRLRIDPNATWDELPFVRKLGTTAIMAYATVTFMSNITPSFTEARAPIYFAVSTLIREAASFASRRSLALSYSLQELPERSSSSSTLVPGFVWLIAAAVSVETKGAALRLIPMPEEWHLLTNALVSAELVAHLGAATGYISGMKRGWNVRATSRVFALGSSLVIATAALGFFLGMEGRQNITAWILSAFLVCMALGGSSAWAFERGMSVALNREWTNLLLAVPAFSSLWILTVRPRNFVGEDGGESGENGK